MSDTRQPGGGKGRGLPPWLSDEPLPPRPAAPAPPAPVGEENTLPDWLRELRATVDDTATAPAASSPTPEIDWLGSSSPAPERAPQPDAAGDQPMPDWLRELASSTPEPEAPAAPAPPPPRPTPRVEGATSWLASLAQPAEQEPPAPPAPPPAPPPGSRPLKRMPSGATDWLRSLGQEPDPQAAPARPAEPPQEPARPASASQPPPDDGVPSWLSDISEEELARDLADSAEAPASAPRDEPDLAMPSWLAGIADQPDEPAPEAPAMPLWLRDESDERGETRAPAAGDDDNDIAVPDWLRTAREDAAPTDPSGTAQGATPAWLQSQPEQPETAQPSMPSWLDDAGTASSGSDVPAWLRDADDEPDSAPSTNATDASPAPIQPEPARATPQAEPDVPAWLRSSDAPEPPRATPQAEPDVPAWLRDADDEPPPASQAKADVPAWLRDAEDEPPPASQAKADVPAWLRDADDEPLRAVPPASQAEPDVPAWLRDAEPNAPASDSASTEETLPGWMRASASEELAPAPPSADADDIPPWLRDADDEPRVAPAVPGDANLPAWLRGADERPSAPTPAPAPMPSAPDDAAALPPWLLGADEEAAGPPSPAPETRSDSGDFLGGSDLPGWLRSPDAESAPAAPPPAPGASDWLERLRAQEAEADADGLESEVATATVAVARPSFTRTPAQLEAIGLLQRLVATPYPQPAPKPVAAPQPAWRRVRAEQVLYLLLLLALLAGLFVPSLSAPLAGTNGALEAATIAAANEQLNDNSRVLVAYEWDARRRSELGPLEQTVMDHLARRHVKFVFMSTDVQGTLLSFDARDRLVDEANGYDYLKGGRDYVLLGYRPGGELALRALAQDLPGVLRSDFQGQDATKSAVATDLQTGAPLLTSLNDFAQIVVMADDPQDVQGWMEQVHSQAPNVPVLLLLPEETTPIVQPYLRQPNIFYLAGKSGALAYSQARGGEASAAAVATSGQLSYAVAAFVVLALIGALIGGLFARRGAA